MNVPPADPSTPGVEISHGRKVWRVGTLTYTAGGLVVLFCWLLWGDFAWQLKERAAPPVVQIMLRMFQASDFLTGLFLSSVPAAIGLLIGPIISYYSDRHRGRWGRRIPYLLLTAPVATLSMAGLALGPWLGTRLHAAMGWSPESLNFTIILVLGLSWTGFEFTTVAANAVFNGLINDVVPHVMIGRFFGLFRAVSLISGMFFNYYLIGQAKVYYLPILAGIGLLYGGGLLVMCLKVKEGDYPPPPAEPAHVGFLGAAKSYGKICFSKPYYLWVLAAMALAQLAFAPVNLFSVYSAESFGLTMSSYGKYIVVTYSCSLVLAYPLGWLADRFHPLRVGLFALTAYAVVMAIGYFGIVGPASFGIVFLVHGVLSGCYFTGAAALGQLLFPKDKFAQFAAAVVQVLAIGNIVMGPAVGRLLDALGHDYRYTFGGGAVIALAALFATLVVYHRWKKLGGDTAYVAPE